MKEFAFKVNVIAQVRVIAADESSARKLFQASLKRPTLLKSHWPIRVMRFCGTPL